MESLNNDKPQRAKRPQNMDTSTDFYACQSKKFLVRLYRMSDKLSVSKQCVSRNRRRHMSCRFFICNMYGSKADAMFFCRFRHSRRPVIRKRTLIGIIQNKPRLANSRVFGAFAKFRRHGVGNDGQIHKRNTAIRFIRYRKALVLKIFRIGKKLSFRPSAERIQTPFLLCSLASLIHSPSKSLEYPFPFIAPAIHKQSIYK